MTTFQALVLGLLQGASELFPVSSLGHAVLLPAILHWNIDPASESFVPFLVLLHIGTATALLWLYRVEWYRIIVGLIRAAIRGEVETSDERMAMLLIVGTIPVGVVGFFLESPLKSLFAKPTIAAVGLILNGGVLFGAEMLRRRREREVAVDERPREEQERAFADARQLGFRAAAVVGFCQIIALVPGFSRSGATMAGGLVAGLRHEEAAHFSFLLATPVIFAAGVLEIPQLFGTGIPVGTYLIAAILSGVAAYASARFLLRYFESGRLDPYAAYCAAAGAVALAIVR